MGGRKGTINKGVGRRHFDTFLDNVLDSLIPSDQQLAGRYVDCMPSENDPVAVQGDLHGPAPR